MIPNSLPVNTYWSRLIPSACEVRSASDYPDRPENLDGLIGLKTVTNSGVVGTSHATISPVSFTSDKVINYWIPTLEDLHRPTYSTQNIDSLH